MRFMLLLPLLIAAPAVAAAQSTVDVRLTSFDFTPSQIHLHAGQPVTLRLTNPGIDAWKLPGFAYDEVADHRSWAAMLALFGEVF